jgi:hypothetical protein
MTDETPARSAAQPTPVTLCLKLPATSLGELKRHPEAIATPIITFEKYEKTAMGITMAIVRTMALEKSVLLRKSSRSLKYFETDKIK